MRRKKNNGFSLIELLVVVAIILVIAAIAIPNLMKARISANESATVSAIHAINTSEIAYSTAYPTIGFSAAFSDLGPTGGGSCPGTPTAACYIDSMLANGTKSGYAFTYKQDTSSTPSTGYTLNADPVTPFVTGNRHFYSDQFNVTHYNQSATAGPGDSVIQ
jgi:type IV pilus assembly protein PilA